MLYTTARRTKQHVPSPHEYHSFASHSNTALSLAHRLEAPPAHIENSNAGLKNSSKTTIHPHCSL